MGKAEVIMCRERVLRWGEALYDKIFYGSENEVGRTITAWRFPNMPVHAKQVFSMKHFPDKTVKTITTCYAGAEFGLKPLVRETVTTLHNGTQRADIAYINGSNVIRATGSPSDPAVQKVCRIAYGLNPDAKTMLWGRF